MVARHRPAIALIPKVRGRPFKPGNPGRPPGSKNKTTRLIEQLVENEAAGLTGKIVQLALEGNVRCLEYCLDRLLPRRSGRSLDIQLPTINTVHDIVPAIAAIVAEVNNGNLSAEEASHLVHLLQGYETAVKTDDFAIRLENLESRMKKRLEP
jgi:hypothetical protein